MTDPRPGDTRQATIARGPEGPGGWRDLVTAPGEPHQRPVPAGEALACIWHLSDVHICDAESPARIEYLDRYSDPDSAYRDELGDVGTYRPQEILTVQVAVSMIETVNERGVGPVTGRPVDRVVLTGDLIDNAQRNELDWYQRALEGGRITPRSGDPERSSWVGVTDPRTWDDRYWHPEGAPAGVEADRPTVLFGYPTVPGLVEAARADVVSPGLAFPWTSVHGNHDALLQGTVAPTEDLNDLAVGPLRVVGLPGGADPMITAEAISEIGPARYVHDPSSPRVPIPEDASRALLTDAEFMAATHPSRGADRTYFAEDLGDLRLVCLDTVNAHGGWQGSLDPTQLDWLIDELTSARTDRRRVLVASHHPSFTLTNGYSPNATERRVLGAEVLEVLLGSEVVIGWIAGHVHFHSAQRHGNDGRGFWEITSASLIDWPQQARLLEILSVTGERGPEIAIVSTVMDHAAPVDWSRRDLEERGTLASLSRALAANDYRLRDSPLKGLLLDSTPGDRNAVWTSPDPLGRR